VTVSPGRKGEAKQARKVGKEETGEQGRKKGNCREDENLVVYSPLRDPWPWNLKQPEPAIIRRKKEGERKR